MTNYSKLKICLAVPIPPPYGGISNWAKMMIENSPKELIEYNILNLAPKKTSIDGINLFDRIIINGIAMLKIRRKFIKLVYTFKPDLLHMTTSGQLAVLRDIIMLQEAKKRGIPSFYHIRFGRISEICKKQTKEWKLISKAMNLATEVIVIDKMTYKAILEELPDVRVTYIPNPILLYNLPDTKIDVNNEITFIGWVLKEKGIEELLEAWTEIYGCNKEWILNIVGPVNNEYKNYLKSMYSFDGVNFVGEKGHDEAMEILMKSKIFILPSYTEGFPNTVVEAMMYKKAIIATKVGAIPEMLGDYCGELIESKSAYEIKTALLKLIKNEALRNTYGENARNKALIQYSFDIVFNQYMYKWSKY